MVRDRHPLRRLLLLGVLLPLTACGPLPWVRHRAVLAFVVSESKDPMMRVFLSTDMEGNSVESKEGVRISLTEAQKVCEEVQCDWWEYKDDKRELSVMHINGRERERWVGYRLKFEKDASGWVAKAVYLGQEKH